MDITIGVVLLLCTQKILHDRDHLESNLHIQELFEQYVIQGPTLRRRKPQAIIYLYQNWEILQPSTTVAVSRWSVMKTSSKRARRFSQIRKLRSGTGASIFDPITKNEESLHTRASLRQVWALNSMITCQWKDSSGIQTWMVHFKN